MERNYTRLRFSGNPSCLALMHWLYQDSTIYMKRKYNIYAQIPRPFYKKFKYKGIYKKGRRYTAKISCDGNQYYLGSFRTVEDAVNAYNQAAVLYGEQIQTYQGEELLYE